MMKQMSISRLSELEGWKNEPYLMDKNVVTKFWDMVRDANDIVIVGDYDCDGVTASAIMIKAIREVNPKAKLKSRIPKRMTEGYGFNQTIADEIKAEKPEGTLVITVDNGIAAAKSLEELKSCGYPIIVTDHHELGDNKIPDVDLVINPKVKIDGMDYFAGQDYWCGAAVAYKLSEQVVSTRLKEELATYAGIATVADCMPLTKGNWALVRRTLEKIRKGRVPESITNLITELNQSAENCSEDTLGFYLCPAINAAGRLIDDGASKPLRYLISPNSERCKELVELNLKRRAIRDEMIDETIEMIESQGKSEDCPIWIVNPHIPEGIVGIVAGAVVERYGVPAIVLTDKSHKEIMDKYDVPDIELEDSDDENRVLKGSGRSVEGINLFDYLRSCGDIFVAMGGHAGACGLSITEKNYKIGQTHKLPRPEIMEEDGGSIVMNILESEIPDVAWVLDTFRPCGEGNPAPEFSIKVNLSRENYKMLGKPPVHLSIQSPKYKIMHFYHAIEDENGNFHSPTNFILEGEVKNEIFRGNKTPTLVGKNLIEEGPQEMDLEIDV